jgi:hemin uptake protein HemP
LRGEKTLPKTMANADRNPPDLQESASQTASREPATPDAEAGTPRDEMGPILSESLLRGRNEIQILHRGELYRLCLTRAGKLILHK